MRRRRQAAPLPQQQGTAFQQCTPQPARRSAVRRAATPKGVSYRPRQADGQTDRPSGGCVSWAPPCLSKDVALRTAHTHFRFSSRFLFLSKAHSRQIRSITPTLQFLGLILNKALNIYFEDYVLKKLSGNLSKKKLKYCLV